MLGPPERDLWLLLYVGHDRPRDVDNAGVIEAYEQAAGPTQVRPYVLELFRAGWQLSDVSSYSRQFSAPHDDTADLQAHWQTLNNYLPASQNWPQLA